MLIGSLVATFRRNLLATMKAEAAGLSEKSAANRSTKVIYRNAVIPLTSGVKQVISLAVTYLAVLQSGIFQV
jgi:hypothetical protein